MRRDTVLSVPMVRGELSSIIIALNIALEQVQMEDTRADVRCVRERLTNLLLMCMQSEQSEQDNER